MSFTPKSAKNAVVRVGNATYACKSWDVNPTCDVVDVTHTEASGHYVGVACVDMAEVTVDADFDTAQNPYDAPIGVQAGASLTNVKLYLNTAAGPFWLFPTLIIKSAPQSANVKDTLKLKFTGVGSGTFTYPTGAA